MNLKQIFGTNKNKSEEGAWVPIAPDVSIKVKRAGQSNKGFMFESARLTKPYQRQIAAGTIDFDKLREINITCYAKHIVVDWKGVRENGKEVPFSQEKFIEFSNLCPDFFAEVMTAATEIQNFQDAEDEVLIKKPARSTATA